LPQIKSEIIDLKEAM